MRLHGLLCWYDEDPGWLAECVACLRSVGVDHLVAVDGAYALLPKARPRSSTEQASVVLHTAHGAGMSVSLHTPPATWQGNEVEKRTFMFRMADLVADDGDWLLPMDADQFICPAAGLKADLEATDLDAAEVMFVERNPDVPHASTVLEQSETRFMVRILFRWTPGITVQHNHYTYVHPDGHFLWNGPYGNHIEALEFPDVVVEHRSSRRPKWQQDAKQTYWTRRADLGAEALV